MLREFFVFEIGRGHKPRAQRVYGSRSASNIALHSDLNLRPFGLFGDAFGPNSFREVSAKLKLGFSKA